MVKENYLCLSLIICAVLGALTIGVFHQVGGFDYIANYDDDVYAFDNPYVLAGLNARGVAWAFSVESRSYGCNWHPLTWISMMADTSFFGAKDPDPLRTAGPRHVVNLILHLTSVLLLFLLLRNMTSRIWPSAFVAALFAVHPLHVESVAWVAERKDVLSTLFWILTMWAYVSYARKPGLGRYALVALSLALGLMAKPMLVTLPIVLLLMDYWPLKRHLQTGKNPASSPRIGQRLALEKTPLLLLSAGSSYMTWLAQHGGGAVAPTELFTMGQRIANALVSTVEYLVKMVYPAHLAVHYPHPENSLPQWMVAGSALLLVLITAGAIRQSGKRPYLIVGWLWYLVTLVPVIGLVQVGMQGMADRYTYVPLIGIFVIIAWAGYEFASKPEQSPERTSRKSRKIANPQEVVSLPVVFLIPSCAVVLVLACLCWKQVSYWQNGETLFLHAVTVTENNARAYNNLGTLYTHRGDIDSAEKQLRRAIEIDPNFADALNNYGQVLYFRGRAGDSIPYFQKALGIDPTQVAARSNLAMSYSTLGRLPESIRELELADKQKPGYIPVIYNLARTLRSVGRTEDAVARFQEILRLNPGHPDTISCLARIYSTSADPRFRNGQEALEMATGVCAGDLQPNLFHLQTLASSYAEVGRFAEAIDAAKRAISVAQAQKNQGMALLIQKEIGVYGQHRAYRE
jgi:protein O-mannosyl-transferase